MTNEEAEQLIAEIKEAAQNEVFNGGNLNYAQLVEKIIKRFANKPPYGFNSRKSGLIEIRRSYSNDDNIIQIGELFYNIDDDELKQLHDNCNKMLDYLEDKE